MRRLLLLLLVVVSVPVPVPVSSSFIVFGAVVVVIHVNVKISQNEVRIIKKSGKFTTVVTNNVVLRWAGSQIHRNPVRITHTTVCL